MSMPSAQVSDEPERMAGTANGIDLIVGAGAGATDDEILGYQFRDDLEGGFITSQLRHQDARGSRSAVSAPAPARGSIRGSRRRKAMKQKVGRWAPVTLPAFLRGERTQYWEDRSRIDGCQYMPPVWEAARIRHLELEMEADRAARHQQARQERAEEQALVKIQRAEKREIRERDRAIRQQQRTAMGGPEVRYRNGGASSSDSSLSSSESDSESDLSDSFASSSGSDDGKVTLDQLLQRASSNRAVDAVGTGSSILDEASRRRRNRQAKRRRRENRMPTADWAGPGMAGSRSEPAALLPELDDTRSGRLEGRNPASPEPYCPARQIAGSSRLYADGDSLRLDEEDEDDSDQDEEMGAGAKAAARHARLNSAGATALTGQNRGQPRLDQGLLPSLGPRLLPTLDFKLGSQSTVQSQGTITRHFKKPSGVSQVSSSSSLVGAGIGQNKRDRRGSTTRAVRSRSTSKAARPRYVKGLEGKRTRDFRSGTKLSKGARGVRALIASRRRSRGATLSGTSVRRERRLEKDIDMLLGSSSLKLINTGGTAPLHSGPSTASKRQGAKRRSDLQSRGMNRSVRPSAGHATQSARRSSAKAGTERGRGKGREGDSVKGEAHAAALAVPQGASSSERAGHWSLPHSGRIDASQARSNPSGGVLPGSSQSEPVESNQAITEYLHRGSVTLVDDSKLGGGTLLQPLAATKDGYGLDEYSVVPQSRPATVPTNPDAASYSRTIRGLDESAAAGMETIDMTMDENSRNEDTSHFNEEHDRGSNKPRQDLDTRYDTQAVHSGTASEQNSALAPRQSSMHANEARELGESAVFLDMNVPIHVGTRLLGLLDLQMKRQTEPPVPTGAAEPAVNAAPVKKVVCIGGTGAEVQAKAGTWNMLRTVMRGKVVLFPEIATPQASSNSAFRAMQNDDDGGGGVICVDDEDMVSTWEEASQRVHRLCDQVVQLVLQVAGAEAQAALLAHCSASSLSAFESVDQIVFPHGSCAATAYSSVMVRLQIAKEDAAFVLQQLQNLRWPECAEGADSRDGAGQDEGGRSNAPPEQALVAITTMCEAVVKLVRMPWTGLPARLLAHIADEDVTAGDSFEGADSPVMCPSVLVASWVRACLVLLGSCLRCLEACSVEARFSLSDVQADMQREIETAWLSVWRKVAATSLQAPWLVCSQFDSSGRTVSLTEAPDAAFLHGGDSDGLVLHSPVLACLRALWHEDIGRSAGLRSGMIEQLADEVRANSLTIGATQHWPVVELLLTVCSLEEASVVRGVRAAEGPGSIQYLRESINRQLAPGALQQLIELPGPVAADGYRSRVSDRSVQPEHQGSSDWVELLFHNPKCGLDASTGHEQRHGSDQFAQCALVQVLQDLSMQSPRTAVGRRCQLHRSIAFVAQTINVFVGQWLAGAGTGQLLVSPVQVVQIMQAALRGMDGNCTAALMPATPSLQAGRCYSPRSFWPPAESATRVSPGEKRAWTAFALSTGVLGAQPGLANSILDEYNSITRSLSQSAFGGAGSACDFDGGRDLRVCLPALFARVGSISALHPHLVQIQRHLSSRQSARGASDESIRRGVQSLLQAATTLSKARALAVGIGSAASSQLQLDDIRLNARTLGSIKAARHWSDVAAGRVLSAGNAESSQQLGILTLRLISVQSHLARMLRRGMDHALLTEELQYIVRILAHVSGGRCRSRVASVLVMCQVVQHLRVLTDKVDDLERPTVADIDTEKPLLALVQKCMQHAAQDLTFQYKIASTRQELLSWGVQHLLGQRDPPAHCVAEVSSRVLSAPGAGAFKPLDRASSTGGVDGPSESARLSPGGGDQRTNGKMPLELALQALRRASSFAREHATHDLRAKRREMLARVSERGILEARAQQFVSTATRERNSAAPALAKSRNRRFERADKGPSTVRKYKLQPTAGRLDLELRPPSSLRSTDENINADDDIHDGLAHVHRRRVLLAGSQDHKGDGKKPKRRKVIGLLGGSSGDSTRKKLAQRRAEQGKQARLAAMVARDSIPIASTSVLAIPQAAEPKATTRLNSYVSLAAQQARAVHASFSAGREELHVDTVFEAALPKLQLSEEAVSLLRRVREMHQAPFWPATQLSGLESPAEATAAVLSDARQRAFAYCVLAQSSESVSIRSSLALFFQTAILEETLRRRCGNDSDGNRLDMMQSQVHTLVKVLGTIQKAPLLSPTEGLPNPERVNVLLESQLCVASLTASYAKALFRHKQQQSAAEQHVQSAQPTNASAGSAQGVPGSQRTIASQSMGDSLASEELDALAAFADESEAVPAAPSQGAATSTFPGSCPDPVSGPSAESTEELNLWTVTCQLLSVLGSSFPRSSASNATTLLELLQVASAAGAGLAHLARSSGASYSHRFFSTSTIGRMGIEAYIPALPDFVATAECMDAGDDSVGAKLAANSHRSMLSTEKGFAAAIQLRTWCLLAGEYMDAALARASSAFTVSELCMLVQRTNPLAVQSCLISCAAVLLEVVRVAPTEAQDSFGSLTLRFLAGISVVWKARCGVSLSEANPKFHLFDCIWEEVDESLRHDRAPNAGAPDLMEGDDDESESPAEVCARVSTILLARSQSFVEEGCDCPTCSEGRLGQRKPVALDATETKRLCCVSNGDLRKHVALAFTSL